MTNPPITPAQTDALADASIAREGALEEPQQDQPWLAERAFWETEREIPHIEAREAAKRLINSHFRNPDTARVSIPANPDRDDDLVLHSYIRQQARKAIEADALAQLAEIPPAGSEERDFWLEAAERCGFERTRGGEETSDYDPAAYFTTRDAILTLMSEARKQGQWDALGGEAKESPGVLWSAWAESDANSDPSDPGVAHSTEWFVGRWPIGAEEPECCILIGTGRTAEIIARRVAEKLTSILNTDRITFAPVMGGAHGRSD